MPFNAATAPSIITIFEIEATEENLLELRTRLSDIELVDGGSMVVPIESLVTSITTLKASSSTVAAAKQNQVIQAGKVKFKDSGIGQGTIDSVNRAMVSLGKLLGSPYKELAIEGTGADDVQMYVDYPYGFDICVYDGLFFG
jgi:hypothetical protein